MRRKGGEQPNIESCGISPLNRRLVGCPTGRAPQYGQSLQNHVSRKRPPSAGRVAWATNVYVQLLTDAFTSVTSTSSCCPFARKPPLPEASLKHGSCRRRKSDQVLDQAAFADQVACKATTARQQWQPLQTFGTPAWEGHFCQCKPNKACKS